MCALADAVLRRAGAKGRARTSRSVPLRIIRDGDGGVIPPVAACWGGLPRSQLAVGGPAPRGGSPGG